jgi:hypothetical protein
METNESLGFRWEMSSRGRFATPADFPRHECSPYSHVHVRRERLGFVHRSGADFPVAPCQTPMHDSQLVHRCTTGPSSTRAHVALLASECVPLPSDFRLAAKKVSAIAFTPCGKVRLQPPRPTRTRTSHH